MIELSLQSCADAMGAQLIGGDVRFSSVSTDTRTLKHGDLFVALVGDHYDAHEKIDADVVRNASAVVVQHALDKDVTQLLVADTLMALGDIARQWRQFVSAPIIAITGSNGKTTVKEMTAAILRQRGEVFATRGNLNNEIGMPLSLLSSHDEHDFVVLELGANRGGEIKYLSNIARPLVALINNAGPAHLEGFGSLDGVANAKGEIFSGLPNNGIAIINIDDHYAQHWRNIVGDKNIIGFGFDESADLRGQITAHHKLRISYQGDSISLALPVPGKHNAMNALAAAAAAIAVGALLGDVEAGLATVTASCGRLEFKTAACGALVIDDSYNANPGSLRAALDVLCAGDGGSTWCLLGDMRELGQQAESLHRQMAATAKRLGVDNLFAIGEFADATARGFGPGGRAFGSLDSLVDTLRQNLQKGDRVLVKGSRGVRMERVVEALVGSKNIQNREEC
jgi:UDP-N-acetylmuramoyl-tripeptide--D-alanyl-D-alanine ligase